MAADDSDVRWREAGDRIATLLDATAAGGTAARERAEQLVREVVDLYGAGLARITTLVDPELLAKDDLVASLLLVHGLHPHDVTRRVSDALDSVRPYLGSHGGDVSLVGIDGDVVRLELRGSCKTCPSSAVTLELAVEDAVRAAAPEIATIEVVSAGSSVISADSLFAHVRSAHGCRCRRCRGWRRGRSAGSGSTGRCSSRAGSARSCSPTATTAPGAGVRLRDPAFRGRCCAARAGRRSTSCTPAPGAAGHLDPLPLLVRDGVLSLAGVGG